MWRSSEREAGKKTKGKGTLRLQIVDLRSQLGFALAVGFFLTSCASRVVPEPQYLPAASLLDIAKDFQRLAREDVYRFPIPKDVTGSNIMRATLVRLDDYEKKNPGQFSDIINFSKATAYERLRDYNQAIGYYRRVAESDGRLGAEASKNIETLESFNRILQKPLSGHDAFEYIKGLDEKVEAWNEMIHKYQGTPYEYLARIEEEKIDRAKVAFVELNRHRMKDGNQLVIIGYSQLITKHRESKNVYRHLLDFGDFYVLLAKEYGSQNDPEGLTFDFQIFDQFAKSALRFYTEVAQADGMIEKTEAQGKIEGLRGLTEKMRRLNR
jgi:tetratricopeptide (TPR) repeat protein